MSLKPPSLLREAFIVKSIHGAWFLQGMARTYGAKKEKFVQICSNSKGFLKLCRTGNRYYYAIDQVRGPENLRTAERQFGKEDVYVLEAIISPRRVAVMEGALQAASVRQRVISNNVANVNTPGFKKSDVVFESLLRDQLGDGKRLQMARTNEKHYPQASGAVPKAQVQIQKDTSIRLDGNNVDIDAEMAGMAKNSIYYQAVAQDIGRYFTSLKNAIKGGAS